MERNAHYLIVGSFVAAALTLGTIMLLWIAGSYSESETYKRYSIYFQGSVSGLSEGSNVSYRGVRVGRVLSIRFDPKRPEQIKTIIEVDENTPISSSSVVSLQSVGITGLSALAIKTKDADGVALKIDKGEKYPIIPSELSEFNKLLSDAPQITDNAIETLVRVNKLLSEKNLENIDKSIENIALASSRINGLLSDENINNVAMTIKKINATTARFDRILSKNEKQIEQLTGDTFDDISVLVKETQEMVDSFKILAQKLSDDPSQIIYKPNYEGVKVKQ